MPAGARTAAPPTPAYTVEGAPRSVFRQGQVRFQFAAPMVLVAGKPVGTLVEDSVKRRPLLVPADAVFNPAHTQLTVTLNTKAKTRVELALDTTALLPVTAQPLRWPRPLRLLVTDTDPGGTLYGTVQTTQKHFDLQLLDEKYAVVQTLASPKGRYRFEHVVPGKYRLRALIDANGDGHWRGGSPDLRTPAEPVYLDPKVLQLRSNFELEENLAF